MGIESFAVAQTKYTSIVQQGLKFATSLWYPSVLITFSQGSMAYHNS